MPIEKPTFNQLYHLNTVAEGKEMFNEDGSVTTAMVKGIQVGDKIYNVPFYDRDNKKIMSEEEAMRKWLPQIRSGEIQGFDLESDKYSMKMGNMLEHPANVQARKEHGMMDEYARSMRNPESMNMKDYSNYRNRGGK